MFFLCPCFAYAVCGGCGDKRRPLWNLSIAHVVFFFSFFQRWFYCIAVWKTRLLALMGTYWRALLNMNFWHSCGDHPKPNRKKKRNWRDEPWTPQPSQADRAACSWDGGTRGLAVKSIPLFLKMPTFPRKYCCRETWTSRLLKRRRRLLLRSRSRS